MSARKNSKAARRAARVAPHRPSPNSTATLDRQAPAALPPEPTLAAPIRRHRQKFSLYHVDGNEDAHRVWMAPYADAFGGCRRVLDVGCGPGTFLELLRERGIPGLGIDFDQDMVDLCAERGLDARVADARALGELGERFDGIHAGHVVEHMAGEQMVAFLEECVRLLTRNGLLVVRTPNWENEIVRNGGFWMDHTHVRPYPLPLLVRIFEDLGLEVVAGGAEPSGWNDLFILGRRLVAATARPITSTPVVWEGSQLVYHSLAHVNREVALRLIDSPQIDLSLVPYEPHQFTSADEPRFAPIEAHIDRTDARPASVHVRHQWPPKFDAPASGAWVMVQPWEFGGLPADWIAPMRDQVDEIWAYTSHVRDSYVRSGIPADKVKIVPLGVNFETYRPEGSRYPLATSKKFKFLFLGGTIGRKGIDVLLSTYVSTFTAADDVCLVIKAVGGRAAYAGSSIADALASLASNPDAPAIEFIDADLTDAEIASLYRACDALVHPYRGEGFGMPIAEAMATARPVIVTGAGACLDFCDAESAFLIPANEVPIANASGLPEPSVGYWWAEPNPDALAHLMRYVVRHPEVASEIGLRGYQKIREFTWERTAQIVAERVRDLSTRTPLRSRPTAEITPLPLDNPRAFKMLHVPNWASDEWQTVVVNYARSFGCDADATLVMWVDPAQGLTVQDVDARITTALADAGVESAQSGDILLVGDALDAHGLARLHAAVDRVIASPDDVPISA